MTTLTPPLKWAGGKRWLVPCLSELYDRDRRLVDLFTGGLSVPLGLNPERAIANDINSHLINFYMHARSGLEIDYNPQNSEDHYYRARDRFNQLTMLGQGWSEEAAILFYYLNRTCFNGLCRFNQKGGFNVPFGKYKTINYRRDFLEYQEVLSRWEFMNGDFEDVSIAPDDFVYADSPYDTEFKNYSKEGFSWDDQVRLANWLAALDVPVVASNQATDRILDLYRGRGFEVETLLAPRKISCKGDRTPAQEMLAAKGLPKGAMVAAIERMKTKEGK